MTKPTQRYLVIPIVAFLFGFGAVVPGSSSSADRRLSDALEQALPPLVSSGDYWTASRLSFHLAAARERLNETAAACDALSRSLNYYRKSVADSATYEVIPERSTDDEGLQEIRSRIGCTVAQFG